MVPVPLRLTLCIITKFLEHYINAELHNFNGEVIKDNSKYTSDTLVFGSDAVTVLVYRHFCRIEWSNRKKYVKIYMLTAIGLTPAGSSTIHIYIQTTQRTTQTQNNTINHTVTQFNISNTIKHTATKLITEQHN